MATPKRLNKNPLLEVSAEVRFASQIPSDAVVGVVYEKIKDLFGKPQNLPILQIPASMRDNDPNLRYQACYRFDKPGNSLLLGPRNVALGTSPYKDWEAASPTLADVLGRLDNAKLFDKIERIGLRYINFFKDQNIFRYTTLALTISGKSIAEQSITLRAEHNEKDFAVVTQLFNVAEAGTPPQKGSILDIDVSSTNVPTDKNALTKSVLAAFATANQIADDTFFGLMQPDFIKNFDPVY